MKNKTLSVDLIIEIISRLPVKDLMRFKCVSKSWLSLISSDSHLSDLQFERVASSELPLVVLRRVHSRMDRDVYYRNVYNYWFDFESLEDQDTHLKEIHNPFDQYDHVNAPRRDVNIVASCDGLLVLRQFETHSLALLNPSTGKYLMVPPNPAGNENVEFSGFGYDYDRECYKLVTIIKPAKNYHTLDLMIYYVNDTWRKVESKFRFDDIDVEFSVPGVHVNNVLFWHFPYPDHTEGMIFYFDLEEEEFFEMTTPGFGYVECELAEMVAFDDKLCLVCTWTEDVGAWIRVGDETHRTDIWVLSEAESRWTKLFSISDPKTHFNSTEDEPYIQLTPEIYSAGRNKILFNIEEDTDYTTLAWYNLDTEEFENFSNVANDRYYSLDATTCKRSLVGNGMF